MKYLFTHPCLSLSHTTVNPLTKILGQVFTGELRQRTSATVGDETGKEAERGCVIKGSHHDE